MIELAFLIAFVVLFIHATVWEGMINHWVKRVTWNWPDYIKKPLFDCPICMAPYWGSVILVINGLLIDEWLTPFQWIICVFAAGGINTVLIYLVSSDKEIVKELKDDADTVSKAD